MEEWRSEWVLTSCILLPLLGCQPQVAEPVPSVATISIGGPLHTGVQRFGINLSGQTYYDSGQMLRNFAYRNPGFEGGTWQTILHCKTATRTTCTDENPYTVWPTNFVAGARYEILSGSTRGESGTVQSSTAVSPPYGVTLTFGGPAPESGAFLLVRIDKPGNAQTGWWTEPRNGATLSTEFKDLAPDSPGRQALRIDASGPNQEATVSAIFDSSNGRSFLQLRGRYTVTFRAKALSPNRTFSLHIDRLDTRNGNHSFLTRTVTLTPQWQDYTYTVTAAEDGSAIGPVRLTFEFANTAALLDDVALTEAAGPGNPTVFRDEVVRTLRELHPGVLRYMDNGDSFGSSLDNLLASPFARQRSGASTQLNLQDECPIGLHEFLTLAKAVGADPWLSLPPGLSPAESAALIEYLAGDAATPYGARRAALGQREPWTNVFHTIHLELGNEQWNSRSFAGATIQEPKAYAQRASAIFAAARSSPAFKPSSFDLILGSWATVPWWTQTELASASGQDSVSVAPYLFTEFNDASSPEAVFGPMFAQPEMVDSRPGGYMAEQARIAAAAHTKLGVYETNLSTLSGSASQADIDKAIPSLGAGLTVADHMLLMLRDLGITAQCLFSLPEYSNGFAGGKTVPLWGSVIDMGGPTNLRRPQFLALQLVNSAILPAMLATQIAGPSHTWNQPVSANDKVELKDAHLLQTFAFADGRKRSLILLNLSRTDAIPVRFDGAQAPSGAVEESRLTSAHITDSNESGSVISPRHAHLARFDPAAAYLLPPFSMTVLSWQAVR